MHSNTILHFAFFLLSIVNNCFIATDQRNSAVDDENDTTQKVSCTKPMRRKGRAPPSGGVDDVTEEMVEIHKQFIPASVDEFKPDDDMRKVANNWCEVQFHVGCDLIYPLDVALNAAIVPAFTKIGDVAQLWYNERSNYDPKISILDNVKRGYNKGYEVIHYVNMVANYPGRGLGCCRAPCKDGICFVYACAYGLKGAGFWRVGYGNTNTTERTNNGHPHAAKGFEFYSGIGTEIVSSPRTELVRRFPGEELTSIGCSANVAGNGPTATIWPWKYPCHIPKKQSGINKALTLEEALAAATTEEALQWRKESELLFTSIPVLVATCDELAAPVNPPMLLYCPNSCLSIAIQQHDRILQSETASPSVANEEEEEIPDYRVVDVGRSICGQASAHTMASAGLVRVLGGATDNYKFDEQGVLAHQSCTPTQYTFLNCGANQIECSSHLRTPSKNHPWISAIVPTAAMDDIGKYLFILRNSLCKEGEFSFTIRAVLPNFQNEYGILSNYLNPSNFIVLRLDVANGIASLIECFRGSCQRMSRYFIGGVKDGGIFEVRFNTSPAEHEPNGKVTVAVNGENVGVINNTKGPPIGFFGFAIEQQTDLKQIDNVSLVPKVESKTVQRSIHQQESLLPFWRVEGSTANDNLIVS